ncbi:hypothetical protein EWM64_g4121 [Hericium alpestre]|uniref:TauD/TfdA-like domain-containing protein n=1 Tax=Hericium alpestre TaxID=135208 RepID=A0A4Y9ZYB3_9AGAM|nr:hypothetical protein EWM64_g4121 [Hericium alpestre]
MDGVIVKHLSPYIGTEVKGVQISHLSEQGLDELALFVAERKMLVFRDQDFKDIGPERQIEVARHFGPLHKHPMSGNVKGYQEFHVVYRDANHRRPRDHNRPGEYLGGDKATKMSWHSDITYERQPPGTTILCMLETPEIVGGDTLFASQVEAYNRLSPEFRTRLEGLRAVHSARLRAEYNRTRNGPVRREPIESEHPVVRRHPVTGEKALFVNPGATKRIVSFKVEESEYLLKFLFNHIATGADFQIRATYEPGTVVIWFRTTE